MIEKGNILFCGGGGQGILLASELTAYALLIAGFDVKKSEVHGMAQRGGSVVAHLRYGDKVYSPLIDPGAADIQLAFEMVEAARYLPFLHPGSRSIVNIQKIAPPAVATGKMLYPAAPLDSLTEQGIKVYPVDGFGIAREVGEIKATNTVLVGALSTLLPIDVEVFVEVIRKQVPARFVEVNLAAFAAGRKSIGPL